MFRLRKTSEKLWLSSMLWGLILIGGPIVAVVGCYYTETAKARCAEIAQAHGYVEHRVVYPRANGPQTPPCHCRGLRDANGHVDMTKSEQFPLD
jgi:hypothetical protein